MSMASIVAKRIHVGDAGNVITNWSWKFEVILINFLVQHSTKQKGERDRGVIHWQKDQREMHGKKWFCFW